MMQRLAVVVLLLLIAGFGRGELPARAQQGETWRVESVETLDLTAGPLRRNAYLAPDGERFAYLDGEEICFYTISGQRQACTGPLDSIRALDTESVRWSLDNRYLALAQDFFRTFLDADLWIVDARIGRVTNLTEDGAVGSFMLSENADATVPVDVAPVWSADGRVFFLRYDIRAPLGRATAPPLLMAGSPDSGRIAPVGQFFPSNRLAVFAFDMTADRSRLVYNTFIRDSPWAGLWTSQRDGRLPRQIMAASQQTDIPFAVSLSPDGQYALTVHPVDSRTTEPEASSARLVNLTSGEIRLIEPHTFVSSAGWSRSGELVYLVRDPQNAEREGLYIAPGPDQPGARVLDGAFIVPTSLQRQPLVWGANNTLLLSRVGTFELLRVQLARAG